MTGQSGPCDFALRSGIDETYSVNERSAGNHIVYRDGELQEVVLRASVEVERFGRAGGGEQRSGREHADDGLGEHLGPGDGVQFPKVGAEQCSIEELGLGGPSDQLSQKDQIQSGSRTAPTFWSVSLYSTSSVNGAKKMCPPEGNICPPGLRNKSRDNK
jgi:hypothetical protein